MYFTLLSVNYKPQCEQQKLPVVGNRLSDTFYLTNICVVVQTLLKAQHIFLNFGNICCELA